MDAKGKPGLKMRRGLGTTDAAEADALVAEMNVILSDTSWWNAAKRQEAERTFSEVITAAFFDDIQAGRPDSWNVREQHIELPNADEGYARVMFVGTTGAGKTSLLRHVIGSDPDEDRFPSTSTAKTTVSDIEVITAPGEYSGVVTFFSEFWVQANVEECVADACSAAWDGASQAKIADRLLNHRDQRFRLSYTLGSWSGKEELVEEEDWEFDEPTAEAEAPDSDLDDAERQLNLRTLHTLVERIEALSERVTEGISSELEEDVSELSGSDRDAAQELFEERLQNDDDFDSLVHDVMDEVRRRFDLIGEGNLMRHSSGWPSIWTMHSSSRADFIEQIRWFSSNYAPNFGRLLTPVVDGIRIRGPFFPTFSSKEPKFVLLDGQGLGHTPDSSASVTTHITKRFDDVDVVLLVDNAQQPMQAAPLSVIRALAVGGHHQKLAIAFTHFDQVKGINLPTFAAKRGHVMASVTNGLSNLKDVLGAPIVRAVERTIEGQCYMLGALDQPSRKLPNGVRAELDRMFDGFELAIVPPVKPETNPVYNPDGLVLAFQGAARGFRRPWAARLGLGAHESVHKEHWARIKALNRRIAGETGVEYDTLKPVADFLARLAEEIFRFLDNPSKWEPRAPDEDETETALAIIRQQVYRELHALAARRIVTEHLAAWRDAFEYRGKGSTFERAQEINAIYETGAPIATTVMTSVTAEFVQEARNLVYKAIQDNGGKLAA